MPSKLTTNLSLLTLLQLSIGVSAGCIKRTPTQSTTDATAASSPRIGVLMASHGDIDDPDAELEDYIKTAFKHNVGIPLPSWTRGPITDPAYRLSVKTVRDQYDIIGPTRYREFAEKQMKAITSELKKVSVDGKAYFGANFARPYISETLDQMRKDGVSTIVVFNKGAQFSYASSGENMDDVLEYLNENKDWNVRVIGRFQYSEDARFRNAWAAAIVRDVKANFPGVAPKDVCILAGSHGLPEWLTDKGDPAIRQMNRAFDWLKKELPEYKLYHGFLNDDFFPGAKWAEPNSQVVAEQMQADGCQNILFDGRLSFTTHHRATLYDLNHVAREILETEPKKGLKPGTKWVKPKVVLAPNFDDDPAYANLMANLTLEAITGVGDILTLKEKDGKPLAKGFVSTPGAYAAQFKKYQWPE